MRLVWGLSELRHSPGGNMTSSQIPRKPCAQVANHPEAGLDDTVQGAVCRGRKYIGNTVTQGISAATELLRTSICIVLNFNKI